MNNKNWPPTVPKKNLLYRANLLKRIRDFFSERNILEVETPLLSSATVTDPYLHSFITHFIPEGSKVSKTLYLQTSPEFAMKRLLCADMGAIYQMCKAFRNGETGSKHNPEFTMLEWYRPGFDHHELMKEVDTFLQFTIDAKPSEFLSYQEIFLRVLALDPHQASLNELKNCASEKNMEKPTGMDENDRDAWLQVLLTHFIEPQLGKNSPTFIYDFPTSQAALARIRKGNPSVAERFEVYINGVELGNGFHELADAAEQSQRFKEDLQKRAKQNLPQVTLDQHLIAALTHGLPDCAGIAVGVDRLMMAGLKVESIDEVVAFPFDRV